MDEDLLINEFTGAPDSVNLIANLILNNMKLKKYRVTYNVFHVYIDDKLVPIAEELPSKVVITFDIEGFNQIQAQQAASDLASTFLGRDFIICGKAVNSLKPLSIERIK